MLFNSLLYIPFILFVAVSVALTSKDKKWLVVLVANIIFYSSFEPLYLLIISAQITISYWGSIYFIAKTSDDKRKQVYLFIVILVLAPLIFFKYTNFFLSIFSGSENWSIIKVLLPLGISFYTFQLIAYLTDVFWEQAQPEKHFGIFAAAYSFFPLILSGPIERANRIIPQFRTNTSTSLGDVLIGSKYFLLGLFYKVVLADRLAIYTNMIYDNSEAHSGGSFILATVFFTFQIYGDFVGYSLMAMGSAKMLGLDVINNFNLPYFSKSISEFWNRWHISLSTWLRDYIFTPLSYSRFLKGWLSNFNVYFTVVITFLVSGLWHGASWNFVFWGLLNGVFLSLGIGTMKLRTRIKSRFSNRIIKNMIALNSWFFTFLILNIMWIFFRSDSIKAGFMVVQKIFTSPYNFNLGNRSQFFFSFLAIMMIIGYEMIKYFNFVKREQKTINLIAYSLLIFVILLFGVFDGSQFIYFQF